MSATEIIIIATVTAFAAFAIGVTGFGFGLIAMSVYSNIITVPESAALVAVLSFGIIVVNLVPIRKHIRFDILWPLLLSALVGVPVGVLVLVRVDEAVLRIGLGSLILATLAVDLFTRNHAVREPSVPVACLVGVASGALGGAYSTSGPPTVMYLSSVMRHKCELKASFSAFFLAVAIIRLPFLLAGGVLSADLFLTALLVLAPLAAGLALGMIVFKRLDDRVVRRIVRVFLAISAIVLIVRS